MSVWQHQSISDADRLLMGPHLETRMSPPLERMSIRTAALPQITSEPALVGGDRPSVVAGLLVFGLTLSQFADFDLIGWVVTTSFWVSFSQALS
jgi:type IV secretory pathway TrbD component